MANLPLSNRVDFISENFVDLKVEERIAIRNLVRPIPAKNIVRTWKFKDQMEAHADFMWLRSPNALLYDPALRRTLHNLMKKLFMQLVAEFKRLGSTIVYANFNKIIICTKKRTVEDAIGYVEFVVSNIRNKELFHSIQMTYNQCWEYLMWLDPANHGGIKGKLPKGLGDAGEGTDRTLTLDEEGQPLGEESEEEEEEGPEIVMNWNLSEFLPEESNVQGHFTTIVATYMSAIYQHMVQSEPILGTPIRHPTTASQLTQTIPTGVGSLASTADFAKKLITGDLSQKLFQICQRIHKRLPSYDVANMESINFMEIMNKEKHLINPALEFVKSVLQVLSLDPSIEEEVTSLRRNLLRLIDVGEFSDAAEWSDPCASVVLPEVICRSCNHCRDIDLCKDSFRSVDNDIYYWQCPTCSTNYDNAEIEAILLDIVNRRSMGYVLQDLQCKKCLMIKMENMTEQCTCAGQFQTLINRAELAKNLKTFGGIAQHYNMPLLLESVKWILKMNPTL